MDGERVVVVRPDGKRHTVFNNPRRNTQKRITAGARLLEIGGTAARAVLEYVRMLRELALEMMNQGLVWLADNLRVACGEEGLLPLCRMMLRAGARYPVVVGGVSLGELDAEAALKLVWPPFYPAGSEDRARDAATLMSLGDRLPVETVQRWLNDEWGGVGDAAGVGA